MGRKFSGLAGLEPLETRLCPTTFQYESLSEYLNINPVIADLIAPAGSDAINFGVSVSGVGDITGDGVLDFAIGADGVAPNGGFSAAGKVFLFSGSTRELIRTLSDGAIGFGKTLANLGDVNGDGVADLAVASPVRGTLSGTTGAVVAYSGVDGAALWEVVGDGPDGELGRALAVIRDLDNDGVGDLAIGGRVGQKGEVRAVSGATGAVIWTAYAGDSNESFGTSLAPIRGISISPAGWTEVSVAAGAPDEGGGTVRILDLNGNEVRKYTGSGRYGASLASFTRGPADNPFQQFLVVTAPEVETTDGGASKGTVDVETFQFDNGAGFGFVLPLKDITSGTRFGTWVAAVGGTDFAVGYVDGGGTARIRVYSVEYRITHVPRYFVTVLDGVDPGVLAGRSAAGIGDLDGNGYEDFLLGDTGGSGPASARLLDSGLPRIGPIQSVLGGTLNGTWLWGSDFLIKGSKVYAMSRLAGLKADETIVGISDDGSVGVQWRFTSSGVAYTYIRNGQRLTIDQAITSIVGGGVDTTKLSPYKVGPGGHILFNVGHPTIREASTAWVMEPDGTLRFLWNGAAGDVNSLGAVVGTRYLPDGASEPVVYTGGTVSVVPGVGGLHAINNLGDMVGWADGDEVVLVHEGVASVIGRVNTVLGGAHEPVSLYLTARLDDQGRLYGYATFSNVTYILYYNQAGGLVAVQPNLLGAPSNFSSPIGMDSSGVLVGREYALTQVDASVAFGARDPASEVVVSGSGGVQVVATNVFGEPVVFTRDEAGVWHGRDARTGFHVAAGEQDLVSWVDPVDGLTYVVFITDRFGSPTAAMLRDGAGALGAPSIWTIQIDDAHATDIVSDLAIFTSIDGLVHIVGRNAGGELVMMSRNRVNMASQDAWSYTNISRDHLQFQGMQTPAWVSTPVTYVTSWNGLNIAGLDGAGRVHVVWWAPEMTLWRVDDLSAIASAPPLAGGITAYTTSWGGVNIVGATAGGDLTAVWWAPALGGEWLTSSLSEAAGSSIRLRAETLTSYVTPWGGLNVAGVDENGGVTIFWWSLESNRWTASTVTPDLPPVALPAGPLSSGVTGSGAVHIAGVSTGGHVIDLTWAPGGSWELADLTDIAV